MTEPIPALVVGSGHGLRVLVPALRSSGFEVRGLVATDLTRTAQKADKNGIPRAFTDLDEAISGTQAVAVAIATPPRTHAPLVHIALARGCHVLCEKPFALDAEEARTMLAAAERAGVTHLIGNQFRLMPSRVVMGRAIADGLVGEPRLVTITQYAGLLASPNVRAPSWWFDRSEGGGWLGASGSHTIDMIRNWLGEFATLSAAVTIAADREAVAEDTYLVRFTLTSGVEGVLMQTGAAWGEGAAMRRVSGTRGTLSLENDRVSLADGSGTRELAIPAELTLQPEPPRSEPGKQYLHVELPPARALCSAWHRAIEGRSAGPVPLATFADGVACMRVIDAIRRSAACSGSLATVS